MAVCDGPVGMTDAAADPAADLTCEFVNRTGAPCPDKKVEKSRFCDRHTHDWVAAAEVPVPNRIVAGTMRRAEITLTEGTWIRVLDVMCASCRKPWHVARDTPCDIYDPLLRGGPLGTRTQRPDDTVDAAG